MINGLFLCIEGGDGSGKGTQYELLVKRLEAENYSFEQVDFPQYGQPSAELAELYLNNAFGPAPEVDPRVASLFFAVDRLAAKDKILQAKERGALVLANRFTASNMALQGGKLATKNERQDFFQWLHRLEHDIMGIPEPDHHFILHLSAAVAQARVLRKAKRSYTDKALDGHEADLALLQRAEHTYLELAELFPQKFTVVECVDATHEKTPDEIHREIWALIKPRIDHD